jgi:putative ABC transport system permease protein
MHIGPIWRALMRNKASYLLIAVQIAVTMAILVNAIAIIQERSQLMGRSSGVDEDNIFYTNSTGFDPETDYQVLVDQDLDALRQFPGVENAIMTNTVPLQGGGWGQQFQVEQGDDKDAIGTAIYFVDEHGLDTFGVELVAGRNFSPTEVSWFDPDSGHMWPPIAIITAAFAKQLFPEFEVADVVGKTVYIDSSIPVRIIGIVDRMQAAWKSFNYIENSALVPQKRGAEAARYVIRTEAGQRDRLIADIENLLAGRSQSRIIRGTKTMTEVRHDAYLEDRAMIRLLVFIASILTAVTALGIVGLASFSVARRTRQIGTRRALGASRPAILRYFMLENFLISSLGVFAGAVLAVGLNMWMVQTFNLAPLAWYMVPLAMLVLWLVGQVAVFGPARRASRVSPAIATRTV